MCQSTNQAQVGSKIVSMFSCVLSPVVLNYCTTTAASQAEEDEEEAQLKELQAALAM
jgi:hypothetical protein